MSRGELRRYHDLGASTKIRGRGIGFAGVGIKLGLLAVFIAASPRLRAAY